MIWDLVNTEEIPSTEERQSERERRPVCVRRPGCVSDLVCLTVCAFVCMSACRCACMWLLDELNCLLFTRGSTGASAELTQECIRGPQSSCACDRTPPLPPPTPSPHWTGKAAVGSYVMQVIAWCVYSYSAPSPAFPGSAPPTPPERVILTLVCCGPAWRPRWWQNRKWRSHLFPLASQLILLCPFCLCGPR